MSNSILRSSRRLRRLGIVSFVCAIAAVLAGCVSVTSSGGVTTVAFWERTSDTIDQWYRRDCGGDVSCTFFYIRANLCNNLDGGGKLICYAGTELNRHGRYGWGSGTLTMESSFRLRAAAREQQGWDCLALDNNGPVDWILLNKGQAGCVH